jgi:hypothetical protein
MIDPPTNIGTRVACVAGVRLPEATNQIILTSSSRIAQLPSGRDAVVTAGLRSVAIGPGSPLDLKAPNGRIFAGTARLLHKATRDPLSPRFELILGPARSNAKRLLKIASSSGGSP